MRPRAQDEYSLLSSNHAVGIHGYVLVYSITARSSFDNCKVIRDKILDSTGTNWVPIVLVGNKCDLEQQRCGSAGTACDMGARSALETVYAPLPVLRILRGLTCARHSQVPTEVGQKLAQEWKCAFREASAKANQNTSACPLRAPSSRSKPRVVHP